MGKPFFISENPVTEGDYTFTKEFAGFSSLFSEMENSFVQEPSEKTIEDLLAFAGLSSGLQ